MSIKLDKYIEKILGGESLTYEELTFINANTKTETLLQGANQVRASLRGTQVDLCAAMNLKAGKCGEDCKYCSQSSHYKTYVQAYEMKDVDEVLKFAEYNEKEGVRNFELSTSGGALSQIDKDKLLNIYKTISSKTPLNLCGAHGLLKNEEEARQLKEAGLCVYQHNLQTSKNFYPKICTTHTYEERVNTLIYAKNAGLRICSGGIIGLGEKMSDRLEMAIDLRNLGISSMPVNILNPIPGTPYGNRTLPLTKDEIFRSIAMFRLALPRINLIYGAGRVCLENEQYKAFQSGLNGIVVGDFLTTKGNCIGDDIEMLGDQGFEISRITLTRNQR